jgi:hypothetical protein
MAIYDVYNIEQRLQEYDDRVLRIDWNDRRKMHHIICWDPILYEEYTAMTVPGGQLDQRVLYRMMEINPKHFNALEDIDKANEQKERNDEKKVEDMAYAIGDMLHKPLVNHAIYGH